MKKLLIIALVAVSLASCGKDEVKVFTIDPLVKVNFKPVTGTIMKVKSETVNPSHLTALEIVKQTEQIKFTSANGTFSTRMFISELRDTVSATPILKMWGTDILRYDELIDGTYTTNLILVPDFLEANNCFLTSFSGDTIAYIPNTVLRSAETRIKALFAEKNYEPIYAIFNDAYTFIPISGAEYKALNQQ